MFRNREIRQFALCFGVVALAGAIAGFMIHPAAEDRKAFRGDRPCPALWGTDRYQSGGGGGAFHTAERDHKDDTAHPGAERQAETGKRASGGFPCGYRASAPDAADQCRFDLVPSGTGTG